MNSQTTPLHFGSLETNPSAFDAEIWTDGACISNGTPNARAAWAFVSGKTERAGRVEGKQTNNVAEGLAIYNALVWAAEKGYKRVKIYTDSQISLFNVQKTPDKVKQNAEIFHNIAKTIADNHLTVEYVKVLGHSGDPNNERADKLANTLATQG
ncbi:MAG: RNase H family protein [Candidatus Levyibacteriota bacterium]